MEASEKASLEYLRKIQTIKIIANSEIPVDKMSPVYYIFLQRKRAAMYFNERHTEEERDSLMTMIEYYNNSIKKYLGIW